MDTNTRESLPTVDVSKKPRRRFIYLVVAAVLWYVISYVVLTENPFIYGKIPGIYWFALHLSSAAVVAIAVPVGAIIVLLLIPGFVRAKKDGYLLLGFTLALLLWMFLTLIVPVIDGVHHIQTVRYGDHIYYLASRIPLESKTIVIDACLPLDPADYDPNCIPGRFTHEYLVYQCGRRGVICQGIGYEAFEEHKYASEGRLFVNAEGSIVLSVDGKMVWAYPDG